MTDEIDKDIKEIVENAEIEIKKELGTKNNKAKKNDKEPVNTTSLIIVDKTVYEQVFNPETNISKYAYIDKKKDKVEYCDHVMKNGIKHIPPEITFKAVESGAIRLPTKAEPYESFESLVAEIQTFIHTYVDVSAGYEKFSTWYVLFSWVLDNIHTTPYLRVLGDWGSGKSRFLKTVGRLLYKPMFMVNPTAPVVFRTIDMWKGSLVLDEFTPNTAVNESDPLMQVLNCGFERGIPVARTEKDTFKMRYFDVFGAKLISSRKQFKDEALESRCLTETVTETDREDIPAYLPPEFVEKQNELRNKLLYFRLYHLYDIDLKAIQDIEFPKGISRRLKQAFSSFAAVFSFDKNAMSIFMNFIKEYSQIRKEEISETFDGKIVNSIFNLKNNGFDVFGSGDIAQELFDNFGINKDGHPISSQGIGRHLKILKIKTKRKHVNGTMKRIIDWDTKLMNSLKNKYVVDEEIEKAEQEQLQF